MKNKILETLYTHLLWPHIFDNISNILVRCTVHCKDNPIPKPLEVMKFFDKEKALFQGWSIDATGPFPADGDSNAYLLGAINPFSKWIKTKAVSSLYS